MKRYKETDCEDPVATYEFYDDCFEFHLSNGTEYKIQYDSIIRMVHTKKLVMLFSKAKLVYWFPITEIQTGTLEDLKIFLKDKGIKVKY